MWDCTLLLFIFTGEVQRDLQKHFYGMVRDNPLGESFSSVKASNEEAKTLAEAYLHDFLRMVYISKHEDMTEHEVIRQLSPLYLCLLSSARHLNFLPCRY